MSLPRLACGAFALTVLAACTTGATPPVASRPSPIVQTSAEPTSNPVRSPSPATHQTPRPFVIPSPTTPFLRCDTNDLEMKLISEQAAAGNISATIEVRNKSHHNCDLYGYAGLELLDDDRESLPTDVIWSTTSFFLPSPAVEAVVGLPAGTAPISRATFDPQHPAPPVPGHAYIPLSWNDAVGKCSKASQLQVIPPDATSSLVISAVPPSGSPTLMYVCLSGTIYVNPTRAAVRA
jgi:Protein of unknown function (DUF4232)